MVNVDRYPKCSRMETLKMHGLWQIFLLEGPSNLPDKRDVFEVPVLDFFEIRGACLYIIIYIIIFL